MNLLLRLAASFASIGLGAYGGGLVTIPLIQHEIVTSKGWIGIREMASLLAIAQMTPGPVAINAATFTGYTLAGFAGAAVATLSVIAPSLILIASMASFIEKISDNDHVKRIRLGLQAGVLSLIAFAAFSYGSAVIADIRSLILALSAFMVLVATEGRLHPVFVIFAGGLAGIFLFGELFPFQA